MPLITFSDQARVLVARHALETPRPLRRPVAWPGGWRLRVTRAVKRRLDVLRKAGESYSALALRCPDRVASCMR